MRTIDLHGRTIHDAWKVFIAFAYEKWLDKEKEIRVITGHGDACQHVKRYETEPYNRGSFKVRLR